MKGRGIFAVVVITAIAAVAWLTTVSCSRDEESPLIFAAASLVDVMEDVASVYQRETGQSVRFSYGGSHLVANQIIAGAKANAVVVAGKKSIDKLVDNGNAAEGEAIRIVTNRLVAVRPSGSNSNHVALRELLGVGKIAIPDSNTAPAGEYFEAALKELGFWDELQDQFVPTLDVRAALAAATSGNVAYAFVYETDAISTDAVEIAFAIEGESDATIPRYYASPLLADDKADRFIEFLTSPRGMVIFEKYGFRP